MTYIYHIAGNFHWCKFWYDWPKTPQNKFSYFFISYGLLHARTCMPLCVCGHTHLLIFHVWKDSIKRSNGIFLSGIDGERLPRLQRHLDCHCWRGVSLQARDWQHLFCYGSDERWYYGHRSRPKKNLVHLLLAPRWLIPGDSPMIWHKVESKYHAFYVLKVTLK